MLSLSNSSAPHKADSCSTWIPLRAAAERVVPPTSASLASSTALRLRYLANRLHQLGPRPLFELLAEAVQGAPLIERLERYAETRSRNRAPARRRQAVARHFPHQIAGRRPCQPPPAAPSSRSRRPAINQPRQRRGQTSTSRSDMSRQALGFSHVAPTNGRSYRAGQQKQRLTRRASRHGGQRILRH